MTTSPYSTSSPQTDNSERTIHLAWDSEADAIHIKNTMWASGRAVIVLHIPGLSESPREVTMLPTEALILANYLIDLVEAAEIGGAR